MESITTDEGFGLATQFRPILLRLDLLVRRQATQYALSRAQTSILHTLSCHGQLRMSDLARLEDVRVPTTSNSVSVIESLGYVERIPDKSDRRAVCVRLTDLGQARIDQVLEARDRDLAEHLEQLSPEHRDCLAAAVPAFAALLDAFEIAGDPRRSNGVRPRATGNGSGPRPAGEPAPTVDPTPAHQDRVAVPDAHEVAEGA